MRGFLMEKMTNSIETRNIPRADMETNTMASNLRSGVLPSNQVALRKTFGLNEPGCSVDCDYCTLGRQYVGESNRGELRANLEAEILSQTDVLPDNTHVELVGYWYGINNPESENFSRLCTLISTLSQTRIVGADLGIIRNPTIMRGLREAGLTYLHNNLETSERLYPFGVGKTSQRLEDKIETIKLAHEQGLLTTSGILIGLGENEEDLTELVQRLQNLPLRRVTVNFMDYDTNSIIGERFAKVRGQLTPKYALDTLAFLRTQLRPDQSLMVGSGVGTYLYDEGVLRATLQIVDTLHIGSFINLNGENRLALDYQLERMGYEIAIPTYLR